MLASTRAYWKTIWSSPMAAVYLEADVPALVRLTVLVDAFARSHASTDLAEIRFLEDRFGLSPLARRRLQWEIDQAGGAEAPAPVPVNTDERWLKAVESTTA